MIDNRNSPASILIVDDEPQVITALKDLLEDDYTVVGQNSARSALDFLRSEPDVSLIISDQRMPEMSGHEFLARAHAVSPAVRILMTGYSDLGAVIQAINDGKIFGFISKPWDPAYLLVMIHKAIQYFDMMRELNSERTLLHSLMDSLPDEVLFIDPQHRFLRINQVKAKALGLSSPTEAEGKTRAELLSSSLAVDEDQEDDTVLATGTAVTDKIVRSRTSDGRDRWFSTTKAPMLGTFGEAHGVICVARDITARYLAQQALFAQEKRYRSFYNRTPVMMQSVDNDGRLTSVSDYWCEALGYPRKEAIGRQWTDFMTESSRQHCGAVILPELRRTGRLHERSCQFLRKDGRVIDVLLSASAEYGDDDNIVQVHAVSIDVTEKNILQEQLFQAQKLEAIGQLTGGIAHDFNNLLAVIMNNLDLLHDRPDAGNIADDQSRELVDEALAAAVRGGELTRRLLAFARQQPLASRPTRINDLVSDIVKLWSRVLGEHIEISMRLADDVRPVVVDPVQFEAALTNLATNARDAMPRGGRLTISTRNQRLDAEYVGRYPDVEPGEYVTIEVSDTGEGMNPSTVAHIFEPFFTTKERGKGTGLGLSMVFGFAKQSGGHITVHSELGSGTTFHLYLPCTKNDVNTIQELVAEPPSGGSETVLVVEDNTALRAVVGRQLRGLGYRVLEVSDAASAIDTLSNEQIHLLLTDIVMPGGTNGIELAQTAIQRWPSLKIVLTSGYPDNGLRDLGNSLIGLRLLSKPYRRAELARVVREALGRGDED